MDKMFARDNDRRGTKGIAGKHGGSPAAFCQLHHHKVITPLVADSSRDGSKPNSGNGQQLGQM